MQILEEVEQNLIKAQKEKNEAIVSVLRLLKSALKNKEIEIGKALEEKDILEIINKEVKKRKEAIEIYSQGERSELAEKEKKELEILSKYLPEQLSEEQIKKIVKETIKEIGATSPADIGKTIGQVMNKIKGQADGSIISKIVKEELAK